MVYVRLYSTLTKYLKGTRVGEAAPVDLAVGASVRDLIGKLGITGGEVFLVSVNGQIEGHDYTLRDGDKVSLFGPIAGGSRLLDLPGDPHDWPDVQRGPQKVASFPGPLGHQR